MSVEAYYDSFFNWKRKLEEVNYIGDERWYIKYFLCGLKVDLIVRVWAYKWKPLTLYGAFCMAQFEEMLSCKELNADKVFEEMSHPNSLNIGETQTANGVSDKKSSDLFDDALGFVAKTEEALIKVGKVLDETTISSPTGLPSFSRPYVNEDKACSLALEALVWLFEEDEQLYPLKLNDVGNAHQLFDESSTTYLLEQTAEKGELLRTVVPVSTLHEYELLGNEVEQPYLLRIRSIKADHQMFERIPDLNSAMKNNRAALHDE